MTHHPHVHMIVPGGGISLDGERWVACRPGFFLPVRVLSRLFRRLFLEKLVAAHQTGRLFGDDTHLAVVYNSWVPRIPPKFPEPTRYRILVLLHRIASVRYRFRERHSRARILVVSSRT
jgi:hypothetical protein